MEFSDGDLDEPIGEAVENICSDFENNIIVYHQSIIDAALCMKSNELSEWVYLALREDGITIWQAPDQSGIATVSAGGEVYITLT